MPTGYLVSLGSNNALGANDAISGGTVTFTSAGAIGAGQWTWSGTYGGKTYTNATEPGQYHLAADGNVYFVPDYGPVNTLTSSTVVSAPVFAPAVGSSGGDIQSGTAGADTIFGGAASGSGATGDDSISSGSGNDVVFGGDGNDTIIGGAGADRLYGGSGDDRFVASGAIDNDTIVGGEAGEGAGDLIDLSAHSAATSVTFTGNEAGTIVTGSLTITFSEIERLNLGSGNNTVNASATTLGINIDAGSGADTVTGGSGNDTVSGGLDNDALHGGNGNDSIFGGAGSDSLTGGYGDDTLAGGAGADTLVGGTGLDIGDYGTSTGAVSIDLANKVAAGGDAQGDVLSGVDGLIGSAFDDTLAGEDGQGTAAGDIWTNVFCGGGGNDVLDGCGGGDSLYGGTGGDTIYGGSGNDVIDGGQGADRLDGGTGSDTMTGGLGSDRFTGLGFGDVVDGSEDTPASDDDVLDLFGSGWTKDTTNIVYAGGNDESGTVQFVGADGSVIGTMAFSNIETVIPCFTPGTLIDTIDGPVTVEDLCAGDLVLTRDSGYRPILWVGRRDLTADELAGYPAFQPVQVSSAALGPGAPARDMLVSPQHRFLITGAAAALATGEHEVLVAALHLSGRPGIRRTCPAGGISYIHILFDQHEVVRSDGAWSESLQPSLALLDAVAADQRAELLALFPELALDLDWLSFTAARRSLKAHEAWAMRFG